METLTKLFGNEKKVKMMRLFLFNPHEPFDEDKAAERTQLHKNSVKKQLEILSDIDLIREGIFGKDEDGDSLEAWVLNESFRYLEPLHNLLIRNDPVGQEEVRKRLSQAGSIQLLLLSGVFMQEWNARVDLFIVGEELNRKKVDAVIQDLESEVGKELAYVLLTPDEFLYRRNIYDKLVRDVLEYPHEEVVNTLEDEFAA